MNFSQLKGEVFSKLAESATAPIAFTDAQVGRGVNEGQTFFVLLTWRLQATLTKALTQGVTVQAIPTGLLFPLKVFIGGTLLTKTTPRALDAINPGWLDLGPAQPRSWFPVGFFRVGLFPRPDQAYTLSVAGIQQPTDLVGGVDIPALRVEDHNALAEYGTYYCLLSGTDADLDRALVFYQSFLNACQKAAVDAGQAQRLLASAQKLAQGIRRRAGPTAAEVAG